MKAGVVYPQIELGGDTGAVKAFAQAAEDLGYDHIVIYDHVLGAVHAGREPKLTGPYKENDPFHEPLVTYAYLAGVTRQRASSSCRCDRLPYSPNRLRMLTCSRTAGFAWASGSAGTGWNTTASKCPDIFAAAASGRSSRLP